MNFLILTFPFFVMIPASKSSDSEQSGDSGTGKATGNELKCEPFSHTLEDGHVVCNGETIGSRCWTVCIEGFEKENDSFGSFECQESGEWSGERTRCVQKDCGSLTQVVD